MTSYPCRIARAAIALLVVVVAPAVGDELTCTDPVLTESFGCRSLVVEYGPGFDHAALAAKYGLEWTGEIPQLAQSWYLAPAGTDLYVLFQTILTGDMGSPEPGVLALERNEKMVSPECRQLNTSILELGPGAGDAFRNQPALLPLRPVPAAARGRGAGVVVAVLDTGVARSHPELAGAVLYPGIDPTADDAGTGPGAGHGTAVAGLIHLLAPDARILAVRVLDDNCNGTGFDFASGLVRAVDAGARVVNASLGALDRTSVVRKAIRYARDHGVLVVASGGNYDPAVPLTDKLQFPANEGGEVLAVAAVDDVLVAAPFAVADSAVVLSAPGVDVISTYRGGYAKLSGTSFATAFVSGAAAEALHARPALAPRALVDLMMATATPVDPWNPTLQGKLGAGVPDVLALAAPSLFRRGRAAIGFPSAPVAGTGVVIGTPIDTPVVAADASAGTAPEPVRMDLRRR